MRRNARKRSRTSIRLASSSRNLATAGVWSSRHGHERQPGAGLFLQKDLEYLRFLGFASAPDRRELILDRVDWQKLERRLARFHEEAEDWDVWDKA